MLSTAVANTEVVCAENEILKFNPISGTCYDYMQSFIGVNGGYLQNPNATTDCAFCQISDTNVFLAGVVSKYDERWRNFGIMWAYIIFNIVAALAFYWLFRVPRVKKEETAPAPDPTLEPVKSRSSMVRQRTQSFARQRTRDSHAAKKAEQ